MSKYIYAFVAGFAITGAATAAYRFKTTADQRLSHWQKVTQATNETVSAVKGYLKGLFNGSYAEAAAA